MNNGTNNFQNFIGISSLQKTLRNALIPTETTQQFIVKNGIIKEDELRGENRQILKDIMDDYYRGFISETLSSIDDIDWTSLFEKMGYTYAGELRNCGYKFNKWYTFIYMDKQIETIQEIMLPIHDFDEVRKSFGL